MYQRIIVNKKTSQQFGSKSFIEYEHAVTIEKVPRTIKRKEQLIDEI